MKNIFAIITSFFLLTIVAFQVQSVSAEKNNKHKPTALLTRFLTSPCKYGWGFGDKNHCHLGPKKNTEHENARRKNLEKSEKTEKSEKND